LNVEISAELRGIQPEEAKAARVAGT